MNVGGIVTTNEPFDVIVIGGGPAGLSAAIYTSRMGMKTILLERDIPGGRATEAPTIENYPGFPEEISGAELTERMAKQAEKFGATIKFPEEVLDLVLNGQVKTLTTRLDKYQSLSVIIATGTGRKKLLVPGEPEFLGRGVSYCVICDGPLFKSKVVAVVGSSSEALEDALHLSNLANRVIFIVQGEAEDTEAIQESCKEKENIEIRKGKVKAIIGDMYVKSIVILDSENQQETEIAVDGVFISIGEVPTTNLFERAGVLLDERGCIKVDRRQTTNIEGVFAAGNCTCGGMQVVTSVGEGAMAALQAYRHVKNTKKQIQQP